MLGLQEPETTNEREGTRMMNLVYIAGPYRGATVVVVKKNIDRAADVGVEVVCKCPGWFPVIPQMNTAHFDELATAEYFLDGTLELMRRCDAVLMVAGWEKSVGATAERAEAIKLGIPVYERVEDVALSCWGKAQAAIKERSEPLINTNGH